jgi:hypothetical protein
MPVLGRGKRPKDTERMKALALAANAGSDDDAAPSRHRQKRARKLSNVATAVETENPFETLELEVGSDADDEDFVAGSGSSSDPSDETSDIQELTNAEVNGTLPDTNYESLVLTKESSLIRGVAGSHKQID